MIAIVAHPSRHDMAVELAHQVNAEAVIWDNKNEGCDANHLKAWDWHAQHDLPKLASREFKVVLEDDAVPCDNFREQLDMALAALPVEIAIVSLYLGTGYPRQWQSGLRTVVAGPLEDAPNFLTTDALLSCVGYAIRYPWISSAQFFIGWGITNGKPVDQALSMMCGDYGLRVPYTHPSLVNHQGDESLIKQRTDGEGRTSRRRAWRFGTRERWDYATRSPIPKPQLAHVDDDGRQWYQETRRVFT